MQPPPLSTTSIQDPTTTDFAFPTPTDHPASVDLHDAVHPQNPDSNTNNGVKHKHSLGGHRPHLHIPHHLHHRRSLIGDDEPEPGEARGAELLKIPKTREPHARSLDTTTGTSIKRGLVQDGQTDEQKDQRDGRREGGEDGFRNGEMDGYESPATPRPEPLSTIASTATQQPHVKTPTDVWTEIQEERSKSGITPMYVPSPHPSHLYPPLTITRPLPQIPNKNPHIPSIPHPLPHPQTINRPTHHRAPRRRVDRFEG